MLTQTIRHNAFQSWRAASRLVMLAMIACLALAGGCARAPKVATAGPPPPDFDPVALQAKSLELARQAMSQRDKTPRRDYAIGPTDVLEITVFEIPKYTTTARVSGDGTIRFPDLGLLNVSDMSERQIEDLIQKMLKEKELVMAPQVSVFVKELHAREVTVAGEVKTPGVYPIRGGEALIDLISKAGGLSPTAGSYAYVLRGASADDQQTTHAADRTIKVDLVALLLRGEQQWNIPLTAGDRITVPTLGWVHVTGLGVDKPNTYQLRTTPTTLRQVVDDAGGLKYAADHKLLIVRRNPDGRQETFTKNYDEILADETRDIPVQGGDTVVVNRTPVKTAVAFVGMGIEKLVRVSFNFGGFVPIFGSRNGGY